MRLLVQHHSRYRYPEPANLGDHSLRLRPSTHTRARVESYGLHIAQPAEIRWQQDPYGNHVAQVHFDPDTRVSGLDVSVELAVEVQPVNPFDFYLDEGSKAVPVHYPSVLAHDLAPFMVLNDPAYATGELFAKFSEGLPKIGNTTELIVALNVAINRGLRYVVREESGIWTPEETLAQGKGSCRDFAVLLTALLRERNLAARFASGYLIQLTDEGMLPNAPKGVSQDVVDLHAWAEVYLPGAGWLGLDATSGLLCGEGHIPLACTATPGLAAPLSGTSSIGASAVEFGMSVTRINDEPRPTRPFDDATWERLLEVGDAVDARLVRAGVQLTMGGEPTFNSREVPDAPEWNGDALGATKFPQGLRLTNELRARLAPGSAILQSSGKTYPGEPLPRWALEIVARKSGPIWPDRELREDATIADAQLFADTMAQRLGIGAPQPAYEDPWRVLQSEESLPLDIDPLQADLNDSAERRRLARILDRGLGGVVGFALPVTRRQGKFIGNQWRYRRDHLFLVPGDSAMGLRLPLSTLMGTPEVIKAPEAAVTPKDPRRPDDPEEAPFKPEDIRTALCIELREKRLHAYIPPFAEADDFFVFLKIIDDVRVTLGVQIFLEGYPPSSRNPEVYRLTVTPDPGVLEVNLPVTKSVREHAGLVATVAEAALHAGLHAEKYLLDGRMAGSGGGNHLTLGGPTPTSSPFVLRPDLLASLITFIQHHPSLSYLFAGLFVGPTSQAPRIDEARHDSLYELEIALKKAFETPKEPPPPWMCDALFRHMLVDVSGNTHRAEICIDKLFDWRTPHGRQGVVELRAFEMPPHPRMVTAQMLLIRALLATFIDRPYDAPLVRFGQTLHDRYLLPYWLWRDFEDVIAYLYENGVALPAEAYQAFIAMRCPLVGRLQAGDIVLEVRNAIEPWHVLGEEASGSGTSRYVDSAVERIEVRAQHLVPERHSVVVNGYPIPMHTTASADEWVAGVRFRAWAPPHSLHAHLGVHHPLRIEVVDTWAKRSLGACGYHVWHPENRAFEGAPLTRFEAAARRAQRFTAMSPSKHPVELPVSATRPDAPYTFDLRLLPIDHPVPKPFKRGDEK
ncbi:MAG: transglutaminase family protein [Clostridia bacterium]|nr:transglutaminase family protein [Deltaproteobacteria bacterium]